MKKFNKIFVGAALLAFVASCGEKEITDPIENPSFADKTVEETKRDLEKTGKEMVAEMKSMINEPGMKATVSFIELMNSSDDSYEEKKFKNTGVFKTLSAVSSLSSSKPQVKTVLRAIQEEENDMSLIEMFDELAGSYEYNFEIKDFEQISSGGNKIVFYFPASKTSLENEINDGELTINRPQITNINTSEGNVQLPTYVSFNITVNNLEALSFLYTGEFKSDGTPTKIESKLTMGTWQMKINQSYSTEMFSVKYSFTHGTKTLLAMGADIKGNISPEAIEDAEDSTLVTLPGGYSYYEYEMHFEKVVKNANAYFQIMDIKVMGKVDFEQLLPKTRAFDKLNYEQRQNQMQQMADDINKYAALVVVYASDNKAIAQANAYVNEVEKINWWTGETFKEKEIDIEFIFTDKSKSSLEAYFSEGFSGLIAEFNSLVAEINETYGWNLEPINESEDFKK